MYVVDYTHPDRVPALFLPHSRRSAAYYTRLDELPASHRYYSLNWHLFRYPEWLEGGSAWIQAQVIVKDLAAYAEEKGLPFDQLRPVVGSDDPEFDEALAQGLLALGVRPRVADVIPRSMTQ